MAIYRHSALVQSISGSLGGAVFRAASVSPIVAARQTSRPARSPIRSKRTADLARISRAWSTLTDQQRDAWTTAGRRRPRTDRLGVRRPRTGYQLYRHHNGILLAFGINPADLPPPGPFDPNLSPGPWTLELTVTSSTIQAQTIKAGTPSSGTVMLYGWTAPQTLRPTATPRLRVISAQLQQVLPVDFTYFWAAVFGPLRSGTWLFAQARLLNLGPDGQLSPLTSMAVEQVP